LFCPGGIAVAYDVTIMRAPGKVNMVFPDYVRPFVRVFSVLFDYPD
jgi:hypothetical protein